MVDLVGVFVLMVEPTLITRYVLILINLNLNISELENLCLEIRKPRSRPFLLWQRGIGRPILPLKFFLTLNRSSANLMLNMPNFL